MILIKKIAVYQPAFIGLKDVLTSGETIVAIEDNIDISLLKKLRYQGYRRKWQNADSRPDRCTRAHCRRRG